MEQLSEEQIRAELLSLPDWDLVDGVLASTFTFESFIEAIDFVNEVAELAEERQHHPHIIIECEQVTLELFTHDVDGVTGKDIDFAHALDELEF